MIFGIGCDIVAVQRFEKWVKTPDILKRFYNEKELMPEDCSRSLQRTAEYYAVRFAAKEAFSKALGTGIQGFSLSEVFVQKDSLGHPFLMTEGNADRMLHERCGSSCSVHVSLSHEKEYAIAYVVIERG